MFIIFIPLGMRTITSKVRLLYFNILFSNDFLNETKKYYLNNCNVCYTYCSSHEDIKIQ